MLLKDLTYHRPRDLDAALTLLEADEDARPLAGGQSLINVLKLRLSEVSALVDISALEELRACRRLGPGRWEIGAGVTYDELARDPVLAAEHPVVAEVAATTVDVQVRSRGTLGGNVCFNDPASNFPPLLVALGATMHVSGPRGDRDVAAEDFFLGHYRTALEPGELLRAVSLPALAGARVGYSSVQVARDSWALARAAVLLRVDGVVEEARVVLGCVGPVPVRAAATERELIGHEPTEDRVRGAATLAADGIDPPGDVHASSDYRREMSKVTARRALTQALAEESHA